jgi:hypothetical protein
VTPIRRLALVGLLLAGCAGPFASDPAEAAARDLAERSGMACVASAHVSVTIPADLDERLRERPEPGWIVEFRIFGGTPADLARATGGHYLGTEDGRAYVNGRLPDGTWATFVLDRVEAAGEAWITTVTEAVPCTSSTSIDA